MMAYAELLRDPRCQCCLDDEQTLAVHHRYYLDVKPWEYPADALITLCESCHAKERTGEAIGRELVHVLRKRGALASDLSRLVAVFGELQGQWDEVGWSVVVDGVRELLSPYGF